ncbi:MAG: GNAT family N-acetyltransferase [Bacteroidales bacterium]|nr:GNAT family N-acetyltransferase [Bacteroidales bacterium]
MNFRNADFGAYEVRKLELDERVKSFNCGDADLNDFILNQSDLYRKELLAVTYIFEHKESKKVIGCFSLANDRVSLTDFNDKTEFNRFRRNRFGNEKRIRSYPAVKICRLGVDEDFHGNGIGSILLDFIKSYFLVDNKTGCRFITVDAYSAALPFYETNDFQYLRKEESDNITRLLYYDINDMVG